MNLNETPVHILEPVFESQTHRDESLPSLSVPFSLDGEDAGYISYGRYADHHPDIVKLHKCYLLEKFQGQGHGSAMLRHAALAARQLGAKYLRLNVNKHNEKAIRAYLRNGFATIESVKNDIGNGFFMDDFVMQKNL